MRACCVGAKTDKYEREQQSDWQVRGDRRSATESWWLYYPILYRGPGRLDCTCVCLALYSPLRMQHMWWCGGGEPAVWWPPWMNETNIRRFSSLSAAVGLSSRSISSRYKSRLPPLLPWHLASD
jgi:hypothetical protein